MTKMRLTILLLLSVSSALSVFWGFAVERAARGIIVDFKVVYLGARCLLQKHDPYNESQLMGVYLADGGKLPSSPAELDDRIKRELATYRIIIEKANVHVD